MSDKQPINNVLATDQDIALLEEYPDLNDYQRLAAATAIYPGQFSNLGLLYITVKMNGEVGEFAEHVGKAMRDDDLLPTGIYPGSDQDVVAFLDQPLTEERRELMIKELGDIIWYWVNACRELKVDPGVVLATNILKLRDRTRRNKLQGSGDER